MLKDRKIDKILKSITPLIEKIADERVKVVMNEVTKQQIKQYEEFFKGQEPRLDDAVNEHIDNRLRDIGLTPSQTKLLIRETIEKVLKERGVLK